MTAWFVSPQCGKKFSGLANMGSRKETDMAVTRLAREKRRVEVDGSHSEENHAQQDL